MNKVKQLEGLRLWRRLESSFRVPVVLFVLDLFQVLESYPKLFPHP